MANDDKSKLSGVIDEICDELIFNACLTDESKWLLCRGERCHSGLGVVRTNKLEYEDLFQKFQFLYEMCIRVYRIMGRKSRIVPQLGIEILKKKEF